MKVIRYKPLFSVSVSYELAATGVSADGITVAADAETGFMAAGMKLKLQEKNNTATVYFEGTEIPAAAPTQCEPSLQINTDQYFYFLVKFSNKEKIRGLKFHSTPAAEKLAGFPVLYDASIPSLNGPAAIAIREDVRISPVMFTFTVTATQSGLSSSYASLEIKNEKNIPVDLKIPPAPLNDKSIEGVNAVPEFAFSIDASSLQPGVYEFKVGSFTKKFFLPGKLDMLNAVSLIRVLKNNFLEYKKNLNDNSFAKFSLMIPKV